MAWVGLYNNGRASEKGQADVSYSAVYKQQAAQLSPDSLPGGDAGATEGHS